MKFLLFIFTTFLVLLSHTIEAKPADLHVNISAFSGSKTGAIIDAGIEDLRLEIILSDNPILGFGIKKAFNLSNKSKLWLGVGGLQYEDNVTYTARTQPWEVTEKKASSINPAIFIEYEHDSGWFVRASHYRGEVTASFERIEKTGGVDPYYEYGLVEKSVTKSFSEELYFIGYKFKF